MLTIVEFDFARKIERRVALAEAKTSIAEGRFVWIDLDTTDAVGAGDVLDQLGILGESLKRDVLATEPDTRIIKHPDCLQLVLTSCECTANGRLEQARIDVVIGKSFFLTAHDGEVRFLSQVRQDYGHDFVHFAASPGFLLYELWDHLIEDYVAARDLFEKRVAAVQSELLGDVDDRVFVAVGALSAEILRFRNVLVPVRSILTELASRKSLFVSETTQQYLENMVGVVQRALDDLVVDRDVLTNALDLYMSMMSHRTNQTMHRLTALSTVFLPLTFLCGVYGMNFQYLPELRWRYGYFAFWGIVASLTLGLMWLLRRKRML